MAHQLTYDGVHLFLGEPAGGACRVRVCQIDVAGPGRVAVLLLSEPSTSTGADTNTRTISMTDAVPELLTHLLSWTLEEEVPPLVIEHRLGGCGAADTFDLVTFDRWTPRIERHGGEDRVSLGTPHRERLAPADVAALLGDVVVRSPTRESLAGAAHDRAGSR